MPKARPLPSTMFALSSRTSPFLSLGSLQRVAASLPGGSVEIDLAGRFMPRDVDRFDGVAAGASPVAAVWLPRPPLDSLEDRGAWMRLANRCASVWGARLLVVELPKGDIARHASTLLPALGNHLPVAIAAPVRIAVGLRGTHLEGGRPHLVQLRALRRFAEEWDLAIALDLAGALDQRWEAEAAMARLADHTVLVRVGGDALEPSPIGKARVAMRALIAGIDLQPGVAIAVVARVQPWKLVSASAVAASYAGAVGQFQERLRRQREQGGYEHRTERPRNERSVPPM
jgi:hypothetical protein